METERQRLEERARRLDDKEKAVAESMARADEAEASAEARQHPCRAHMRHNEQRNLDGAGLLGVGISSPTILAHLVTSSVGLECFLVHH